MITRDVTALGCFEVAPHLRKRWCSIQVRVANSSADSLCFAKIKDALGQNVSSSIFLHRRGTVFDAIWFIPVEAATIELEGLRIERSGDASTKLSISALTRWQAAVNLLGRRPRRIALLCEGSKFPLTIMGWRLRLRVALAKAMAEECRPNIDYFTWTSLFDTWMTQKTSTTSMRLEICYLIFASESSGSSVALKASISSVEVQTVKSKHLVIHGSKENLMWQQLFSELDIDYIGILQAGEMIPRHATALASEWLSSNGAPEIAFADEDEVSDNGKRTAPVFKPNPDRYLMLSGTLSRGLWLVKRNTFFQHASPGHQWAETLRLQIWLSRDGQAPNRFGVRIPFILTHRRSDTKAAPTARLAALGNSYLESKASSFRVLEQWPLRMELAKAVNPQHVTIIIPSTLRKSLSLQCITAVINKSTYPNMDVRVVVAQSKPLDEEQQQAAQVISGFKNASVTWLEADEFNYSWVNNQIIRDSGEENILLLNDDVSPINTNWLEWMVAYLEDPEVGMVGARLLYPSGTVQHGGVIMGLAGLCDHAFRHLPRNEPGYAWRAVLARQLSAVTGACMLVRKRILDAIGGLDETYPSAFNDVDLALRVGELGFAVIYAPQAELNHYEMQTYGLSHYPKEREQFHAIEVAKMRRRWASVCADDPFHNPNLSLEPGREWELAFPPRVDLDTESF